MNSRQHLESRPSENSDLWPWQPCWTVSQPQVERCSLSSSITYSPGALRNALFTTFLKKVSDRFLCFKKDHTSQYLILRQAEVERSTFQKQLKTQTGHLRKGSVFPLLWRKKVYLSFILKRLLGKGKQHIFTVTGPSALNCYASVEVTGARALSCAFIMSVHKPLYFCMNIMPHIVSTHS